MLAFLHQEEPVSNLLAVDPGLRNPAAALFENGVLQRASRVKIPTKTHALPLGERCIAVAELICAWAQADIDELVIEWPKVYRASRGVKADPADLFPLAGIGMAVAGLLRVSASAVHAPTAHDWIGSLPKSKTGDPLASPRGHRIWSRLSDAEKAGVVLSHDAVDAVGIGLWRLGRLDRRLAI